MLSVTAHAKINLTLAITGRDEAGYHQLVSAVCFTSFGDKMLLHPTAAHKAPETTLTGPFSEALLQQGGDRLIQAAYELARSLSDDVASYDISLAKHIPLGGGLGGGSADAAAYLREITRHWPETKRADIRDQLVRLGADVPACFDNQMHVMSARGETAYHMSAPEEGRPVMIITNPLCHADTKDIFTAYAASQPVYSDITPQQLGAVMAQGSWQELLSFGNDLTSAACACYPQIEALLAEMAQIGQALGPAYIGAQMTGSGASCFALIETEDAAKHYLDALHAKNIWAQMTSFF